LLLGQLLGNQGISNIIVERVSGEYVLGRIRAGILESGFSDLCRQAGAGERMDREGEVHHGFRIAIEGEETRIDLSELTGGKSVICYGQSEITRDLMELRAQSEWPTYYESSNLVVSNPEQGKPGITFQCEGQDFQVECDFIAGCDGFHGASRKSIPAELITEHERVYPFGWLGVLSETPPVDDELIYCKHERGFALCSMRSKTRSRYYIQVPLTDRVEDWSDDAFWDELKKRIPPDAAERLVTGESIEKSIAPLRSYVCEPMQYRNLFLVGDAAHIVPPTGAKGLNLAASDVDALFKVLQRFYQTGDRSVLERYSPMALARVWHGERFSWWMTNMLHQFGELGVDGLAPETFDRFMRSQADYYLNTEHGRRMIAEQYVGVPYSSLEA
jgi:p-hydroxybenzoate 3-monooxygenase